MPDVTLTEIAQSNLTAFERESILAHAVDLHLLSSDEADLKAFDILAPDTGRRSRLFRINSGAEAAGILYVMPFEALPGQQEMTILIHPPFRGRHIASAAVAALEGRIRNDIPGTRSLCASVREHNPLRRELTDFLTREGYRYDPGHMVFVKPL